MSGVVREPGDVSGFWQSCGTRGKVSGVVREPGDVGGFWQSCGTRGKVSGVVREPGDVGGFWQSCGTRGKVSRGAAVMTDWPRMSAASGRAVAPEAR